jgi:hypothetical protein
MLKIYINELGRIRDAIIDVKPMMVFTGDSGLGKSYTAFLIYHAYSVLANDRIKFYVEDKIQALGGNKDKGFTFKFQDLRLWMNRDTSQYLGYLVGNKEFTCDITYAFDLPDDLVIKVTTSLEGSLRRVNVNGTSSFFPNDFADWTLIYAHGLNHFFSSIIFSKTVIPYLMPPARAAFMGAKNAKSAFQGIGMYERFVDFNDWVSSVRPRKNPDDQFFKSMTKRLTNGEIELKDGQTFLRLPTGISIPISAAASSVKELAPLLLLLQSELTISAYSLLFEEPEAHVHPKNQDLVADLIARCFNRGVQFQITTHSDFILGRFNQLIRLGNLRHKNPEKFRQYCNDNQESENLYLDCEQMGAYYFKEQGASVIIEEQDINNGIPFTTFHEIINRQERVDDLIEQYMED